MIRRVLKLKESSQFFVPIFFAFGFILKIVSEIVHEVLGHGLLVLLMDGEIRGIKISLLWPLELSHASMRLPEGITSTELALIAAGGILACIITFFTSLLVLSFIKLEKWLSTTFFFWLAFSSQQDSL